MHLKILVFRTCLFIVITISIFSCSKPEIRKPVFETQLADTGWKVLSVREKIGQIVCLNYNNDQIEKVANGSTKAFLERYPVGSFFIANWLLKGEDSFSRISEYQAIVTGLAANTKYPLLFIEDFEQGVGSSIASYTELTTEMGLGATGSAEFAYNYGSIIAKEARSIGLNWMLHPVADLNVNENNYLTNIRSLTDSAELALKMLPAQIRAMQNFKVAATAKHFPGDGTDCINQHFNTSAMQLSYNEWLIKHGKVFQTLIDSGVMTIMAGHISFPAYQTEKLDGEYLPATLSSELITGLLKDKMGFKGVVVSDALNMGGISGYYSSQLETEIECFKAGADVMLWPTLEFIDTLENRILRNEISIDRLNDAVSRVWNMKKKLDLFDKNYETIIPLTKADSLEHKNMASEIAEASITLVCNKHNVIPLDTITDKNILLVVISDKSKVDKFKTFQNGLAEKGLTVDAYSDLSYFTYGEQLDSLSKQYDKFIFLFYSKPGDPWGTLDIKGDLALSMWSASKLDPQQVVSICFGSPYKNLVDMYRTWGRINAYNSDENSQRAMVQALTSEYNFVGVSPVKYRK